MYTDKFFALDYAEQFGEENEFEDSGSEFNDEEIDNQSEGSVDPEENKDQSDDDDLGKTSKGSPVKSKPVDLKVGGLDLFCFY